jgi:eukaryotic-like serine/threonine-protein kinase
VELPSPHPLIGTILDECYRVEAWMADGGMATVYRGTQLLLDRPIAIKALHQDLSLDSEAMLRFVREVRLARDLSHPNIVRVYDGGLTDDDQAYLVMEYLSGRNLAEFVPEGGLELDLALELFVQLCDGVEAVHAAGLLHRDIKPSNVFVSETRWGLNAKILDFGLARRADSSAANSLTKERSVLGTAGYLAPEQIDVATEPDHRADIYALGALLAYMVVGRNPFVSTSPIATLHRQLHDGPSQEVLAKLAPPRLREIVERAVAREPSRRFPSVAALREAVLEIPLARSSRLAELRPGKPREAEFNTDAIPFDETAKAHAVIAEYPAPIRQIAISILDILRAADGPLSTAQIRDRTRYECSLDLDAYTRVLAAMAEDQLVIAGIGSWRIGRQ